MDPGETLRGQVEFRVTEADLDGNENELSGDGGKGCCRMRRKPEAPMLCSCPETMGDNVPLS